MRNLAHVTQKKSPDSQCSVADPDSRVLITKIKRKKIQLEKIYLSLINILLIPRPIFPGLFTGQS
jgi:hypothetical protein